MSCGTPQNGRMSARKPLRNFAMLWGVCVLACLAIFLWDRANGDFGCPSITDNDSAYGVESWRWWPPGKRCTYDFGSSGIAGRVIHGPSIAGTVVALVLVLWLAAMVITAKRRTRPVEQHTPPSPI
ncbi:MAG: hypothetical protein JWO57_1564 [Pseudonocardiales bacterium]|nr:hypothetical protein [Pseudonocardiales bacterium]